MSQRDNISRKLETLPPSLQEEFTLASKTLGLIFKDDELISWATEGLDLSTKTARSWEAGIEYFRVSGDVAKYLPFSSFIQWARCGSYLAQDSSTLAIAYLKASPTVVSNLRPQHIARWAGLGRGLYKSTWKSSTLATRFFEASPALIRNLSFWEVEVFATLIEELSNKSYDIAGECLALGIPALSSMGGEREAFLSLCRILTEVSWREVKPCLEVAGKALAQVEDTQRGRFLLLAETISRENPKEVSTFLVSGSTALGKIKPPAQQHILDLCEALILVSPTAVHSLLKSLDPVLNKISLVQLDTWFQKGVQLMHENLEGGLAYFKVESSTSEQTLEGLSSSLEMGKVKGILCLYCRALSGVEIEVTESLELVQKGIGWVAEDHASTDGTKVYLPPIVDAYPTKEENFAWFKVVSTHQVAHIEFNSFLFGFDRPSSLFRDSRTEMEKASFRTSAPESTAGHDTTDNSEAPWVTDMSRYFALFGERKLALDIFTALEDGRLDYRVKAEYPGIKSNYRKVQQSALEGRPTMGAVTPLRQVLVELLVRFSLDQYCGLMLPKAYAKAARVLAKIQKRLLGLETTVEDTAEATIRAYSILSRIPNRSAPEEEWESQDFDREDDFSEEELSELLEELESNSSAGGEEEQSYESPEDVDFRGDFKPELVQTLTKMRASQTESSQGENQPLTQDLLEHLLRDSPELEMEEAENAQAAGEFAQNLLKEAGVTAPSRPGQGYGSIAHVDEPGGSLEARDPKTYAYDEWDFRAADYKPKWCIVREKTVDEGDLQFFGDTMKNYAPLVADVRRQFEQVIPEGFRKVRRQPDGDEFDLDAAVEAMIDRRSGLTPSEKVYWFRNKHERDVAVVFLLDMSASTAEAIDEASPLTGDQDAPDDPVEYMMWLRSRREGLLRRNYKRIIDLEKEGVALLIQGLESIGDVYGIYGFSGYGRENVEFYVIKDVDESLTDNIKRRIDKISPLHATRMGPAIRHATSKLERQEAKTKILFLISDGRPQDRGYSREGVEKEYAVHDTHMALVEARRRGIVPFCLTVDKSGHDYLKTMCGDMRYEVLGDIWSLPQRLPVLYRNLTI